jgi:hypothetical protein
MQFSAMLKTGVKGQVGSTGQGTLVPGRSLHGRQAAQGELQSLTLPETPAGMGSHEKEVSRQM